MCPLNNNSKKCGRVAKWQEIERRKMKKSVSWGIKRKRQSYKFSDYLPLVLILFLFYILFLFFVGGDRGWREVSTNPILCPQTEKKYSRKLYYDKVQFQLSFFSSHFLSLFWGVGVGVAVGRKFSTNTILCPST